MSGGLLDDIELQFEPGVLRKPKFRQRLRKMFRKK